MSGGAYDINNLATDILETTGQNVGSGSNVFKQKQGTNLQFKTLVAGSNVALLEDEDTITVSSSDGITAHNSLTGRAASDVHPISSITGLSESLDSKVDTGTSLGSGTPVFSSKFGSTLRFRSLIAGKGISLSGDFNSVTISSDVEGQFLSVKDFGAVGDGITDDRVAIQNAINFAISSGIGLVKFEGKTYNIVHNNGVGLLIQGSGVELQGVRGKTKLTRPTSSNTSLFIAVGIHPATSANNGTVVYEDISISGIEFDGNYTVNTNDGRTQGADLLKMQGVRRFTLRDCYLHGSRDYGLAFQNGGHVDFLIENVVVEDCLHDGIDIKNNGSSDEGGRINNCVFRRCGQGVIPSTPACVDVMGSVTMSNIHVYDFGQVNTCFGIRFKQGELSDGRGLGAHGSSLTNFVVKGQKNELTSITNNNSEGIRLTAYSVSLSNGVVANVKGSGVVVAEKEQQINNVSVSHCFDGFLAPTQFGSTLESANRSLLSNCVARQCTTGFRVLVSGIYISNSVARSNNTGLNVVLGVNQFLWQGGNISNSTGSNIIDNSSAGIIDNVNQV